MRDGGGGKPRFRLTAPEPSEDQLQQSVADMLNLALVPGEAQFVHFPAGGYHLTPAARARLFRLGLRQGWPDLLICYKPGRSLWIELKTATGTVTPGQRKRHAELHALGHSVVVCRRVEDVLAALEEYGVPFRRLRVAEAYYGKGYQGAEASSQAQSSQGP